MGRFGTRALAAAAWTALALGAQADPIPAGRAVLDVQDPAVLRRLEGQGFSLGAVLGHPGLAGMQDLAAASAVMATLADRVADDVAALGAEMVAGGRVIDGTRPGEAGAVFDARWLRSPIAHAALAAVVNRLDRQDFAAAQGKATCGEVRLIYRLAYRAERPDGIAAASRLPFTLNAVYDAPRPVSGGCAEEARRWVPPADLAGPEEQARFLAEGPLGGTRLTLRQLEINLQAARLPSGVEPGFGGQAVYLLRVFGIEGAGATLTASVRPLENTPDIARLKADEALRRDLVAYLKDNAKAIDAGIHALPERFSATKALAYSTFGSARLGNRPFAALLGPADVEGVDAGSLPLSRDAAGLIERLDNATCQGCHQAGATAGFHLLGFDDAESSPYNRLALGASPHFAAETARRAAYVEAVREGREPARFRPLSLAPPAAWTGLRPAYRPAGTGMACLLPGAASALGESWTCGAGETCTAVAENPDLPVAYGQCMPRREVSGLACERGLIAGSAEAPYNDRMRLSVRINSLARKASATSYTCRPPRIGVPGGLAYRQCDEADRAFAGFAGGAVPAEICGLAGGKGFDRCVASKDVASCLEAAVARGNRPACGRGRHCREDYICQALPDDVPGSEAVPDDIGFCSPTYFVFQMRLDGHPDPTGKGKAARIRF